jgi:hypothetical protein
MNEAIRYPYKELVPGKYYYNRPEWCIPARVRVREKEEEQGLFVHFYLADMDVPIREVLADVEFYNRK